MGDERWNNIIGIPVTHFRFALGTGPQLEKIAQRSVTALSAD